MNALASQTRLRSADLLAGAASVRGGESMAAATCGSPRREEAEDDDRNGGSDNSNIMSHCHNEAAAKTACRSNCALVSLKSPQQLKLQQPLVTKATSKIALGIPKSSASSGRTGANEVRTKRAPRQSSLAATKTPRASASATTRLPISCRLHQSLSQSATITAGSQPPLQFAHRPQETKNQQLSHHLAQAASLQKHTCPSREKQTPTPLATSAINEELLQLCKPIPCAAVTSSTSSSLAALQSAVDARRAKATASVAAAITSARHQQQQQQLQTRHPISSAGRRDLGVRLTSSSASGNNNNKSAPAPSPAITNSRLRQGTLYARRQCHITVGHSTGTGRVAGASLEFGKFPPATITSTTTTTTTKSRIVARRSLQAASNLNLSKIPQQPKTTTVQVGADRRRVEWNSIKTPGKLTSSTSSLTLTVVAKRPRQSPKVELAASSHVSRRSSALGSATATASRHSAFGNRSVVSSRSGAGSSARGASCGYLSTHRDSCGSTGSRSSSCYSTSLGSDTRDEKSVEAVDSADDDGGASSTSSSASSFSASASATASDSSAARTNASTQFGSDRNALSFSSSSRNNNTGLIPNGRVEEHEPPQFEHLDEDIAIVSDAPGEQSTTAPPATTTKSIANNISETDNFIDAGAKENNLVQFQSQQTTLLAAAEPILGSTVDSDTHINENIMISEDSNNLSLPIDHCGYHKPNSGANFIRRSSVPVELKEPLKTLTNTSVKEPLGLHQSNNIEHQESKLNDNQIVAGIKTDIAIRDEPITDYYFIEARPFARGKFAQVKRCIHRQTNECFAAKCIKKRRRTVDIRHEILLEIEALKLSYHTGHIVKLYEVFETATEMILILEMANGGELQRVLDDEETIDEKIVKRMVRQILEGLVHLHDNDIAHLDIKPQNLLLTESYPEGNIKLCDFGISRRITKDCEIREICGTPDYVAPEILRYDPISLATDMWSLGVLTYVLLSGYSPFGSENKQQTFCNITQAALDFPEEIFDKISKEAIDFIQKLIVREPSKRLTSWEARNHAWLVK